MESPDMKHQIERVRSFNRFFTQRIGIVSMFGSDLPLVAARVLFEIQRLGSPAAVEIARELGLDSGYLSRTLQSLERKGLIAKQRSMEDGRRRELRLTEEGNRTYQALTDQANSATRALLEPLEEESRTRLVRALDAVEHSLAGSETESVCQIHEHGPGDLGWVAQSHGVFYSRNPGFNEVFESLVLDITASFARRHDPRRERLWIAELDGEKVGSIMLTQDEGDISRLRVFLVEPIARGRGVGSRLLETCLSFARRRGYKKMILSTVAELSAARRLYQKAGFVLTDSWPQEEWGIPVTEEVWELDLTP